MPLRFLGGLFGAGAPTAKSATVSGTTTGAIYTISRLLGGSSTLSLIAGTNSNLSLTAGTSLTAASQLYNATQTAVVREVNGQLAVEYPVTLTGDAAAPPATRFDSSSVRFDSTALTFDKAA